MTPDENSDSMRLLLDRMEGHEVTLNTMKALDVDQPEEGSSSSSSNSCYGSFRDDLSVLGDNDTDGFFQSSSHSSSSGMMRKQQQQQQNSVVEHDGGPVSLFNDDSEGSFKSANSKEVHESSREATVVSSSTRPLIPSTTQVRSNQHKQQQQHNSTASDSMVNTSIQSTCQPLREATTTTVANTNTTTATVQRRKISFSTISIREYPVILGDNPGGASGPPLTIAWEYYGPESTLAVDLYESNRPQRRTQAEMSMPASLRWDMLRAAGYSRQEIQQAEKQVNILRGRRRRTVEMLHMAPVHEFSEKIVKGTMKALLFRKTKVDLLASILAVKADKGKGDVVNGSKRRLIRSSPDASPDRTSSDTLSSSGSEI